MIGWYCNVGVCSSALPNTLDELTVLDAGVRFIIPFYNGNIPSAGGGWPFTGGTQYMTTQDGGDYLEQQLGDDYYYCYALRTDRDYNGTEIQDTIPSIDGMYSNTNNSFSSQYKFIHLITLDRVIVFNSTSAYNIFSVSSGSLSYIDNVNANFLNMFDVECGIITISGYNDGDDLSNTALYRLLSLSGNSSAIKIGIRSDSYTYKFVKAIFSNTSVPDFTVITPDNPYAPGGDSGEGGGNGTFDGDSDQIPDSSLPTLSSADTGFTRIYAPTLSQVQSLARYLWTDESIVETLWNVVRRYFEDPMQAFISFSIVPVPVPIAGQEEFKVLFIPTGVTLNTVANQFVDVDCGTFEMKEYYGSALDYSPYTKVTIFLPFIGSVTLNTDDIMGRTLQVKYRVDICSGACVAKVLVDGNVIYQFPGCCHTPIPFSSADFSTYGSAILSAVKTGVAVAAGAAAGPMAGAALMGIDAGQQTGKTTTWSSVETARNPATGRQITTGTTKLEKVEQSNTEASLAGIAQAGIANTVSEVQGSKPTIERSGSFSGNSGYLGIRRPYLIIERPRMCMPSNYQTLNGFPSMITMKLSECTGYTKIQQVQLTGVEATNPEQAEILQLLKGGVIF